MHAYSLKLCTKMLLQETSYYINLFWRFICTYIVRLFLLYSLLERRHCSLSLLSKDDNKILFLLHIEEKFGKLTYEV